MKFFYKGLDTLVDISNRLIIFEKVQDDEPTSFEGNFGGRKGTYGSITIMQY